MPAYTSACSGLARLRLRRRLAARFVAEFLRGMFPYFTIVRRAVGIALHCGQTVVLCWGASGTEEVRASHRQARNVQVVTAAKMQGMVMGVDGGERWAAPTQKFLARARHVWSLGLAWADRVLAYPMLAPSVLRFVGQFAMPDGGVLRTEQPAMAMLTGAPMHSMGPGIAEHLMALGASRDFGFVEMLVVESLDVPDYLERIRVASGSEEAAFAPRRPEWIASNTVTTVKRAHAHYLGLSAAVRERVGERGVLAHL